MPQIFRLIFYHDYPQIINDRFKLYDWIDFYKHPKEDIPSNIPEPMRYSISTLAFEDTDLAGDKLTRRSQTGILIFCNKCPTHWFSKK